MRGICQSNVNRGKAFFWFIYENKINFAIRFLISYLTSQHKNNYSPKLKSLLPYGGKKKILHDLLAIRLRKPAVDIINVGETGAI